MKWSRNSLPCRRGSATARYTTLDRREPDVVRTTKRR